ncbi:MAG: hypothetical protein ACREXW_07360 [Gammaproteobacteria bacterium]
MACPLLELSYPVILVTLSQALFLSVALILAPLWARDPVRAGMVKWPGDRRWTRV